MDDGKTKSCVPCENQTINKLATHWCSDCSLSLCETCLGNHNLIKTNHHVITSEQQTLVNSLDISFTEYCTDHSRICNMYCPTDECIVCIICAQRSHCDCTPAVPIAEVSQNSKDSTLKENLEQEIQDVIRKLEEDIKERLDNKHNIERQKLDILNQITNTRKLIDSKLDKFQEEIIQSLNAEHDRCEEEISNLEKQLEQHRKEFFEVKDHFTILMKYSSNVQAFVGLRSLSKTTWEKNKILSDTTKKIKTFELRWIPNEEILTTCDSIKSYGDIVVDKTDKNSEYLGGNVVQAPTVPQKSVLEKKTSIRLPRDMWFSNNVQSCAILPNEKLVFLDKAFRKLVTMYPDGKIANTVKMNGEPFDIAVITSRLGIKVAVTFPWGTPPRLDIMYIDDFRPVASTNFDGMCFGVTYDNNNENLMAIVKKTGVVILDISGTVLKVLSIFSSGYFYLHYSENKLYFSDEYKGQVAVYDLHGNEILSIDDILSPRALSSDDLGYLYVSCSKKNQVLRIKKNGDHKIKLLEQRDGMLKPSGIYFSKECQLVLVSNESNGQAFLYSVRKERLGSCDSFHEKDTAL